MAHMEYTGHIVQLIVWPHKQMNETTSSQCNTCSPQSLAVALDEIRMQPQLLWKQYFREELGKDFVVVCVVVIVGVGGVSTVASVFNSMLFAIVLKWHMQDANIHTHTHIQGQKFHREIL